MDQEFKSQGFRACVCLGYTCQAHTSTHSRPLRGTWCPAEPNAAAPSFELLLDQGHTIEVCMHNTHTSSHMYTIYVHIHIYIYIYVRVCVCVAV